MSKNRQAYRTYFDFSATPGGLTPRKSGTGPAFQIALKLSKT